MTIPSTITFPLRADFSDFNDVDRYMRDMVFELQNMYEELAAGVNGSIKSDAQIQRENWTPEMEGTGVSGTFTYTHQVGWVFRQGIIVDCWFDVAWTASGAAAGNLYLKLPYKVANSNQMPFSEALQTSTIAYGAGQSVLSVNAIPNTFRGEIWSSGSGTVTANIAVAAAGRLLGHIRYIGVQNEA
jgi:hypothetical protein